MELIEHTHLNDLSVALCRITFCLDRLNCLEHELAYQAVVFGGRMNTLDNADRDWCSRIADQTDAAQGRKSIVSFDHHLRL